MPDTSVTIAGNCTNDAELRTTKSNLSLVSFGVAVSSRRKNDQGQWEDGETSFYDVTCFGRTAENAALSVRRGQRVVVSGQLRQSSWEQDGQKRSKIEIIADEIGLSLKWDAITTGGGSNVVPETEPF